MLFFCLCCPSGWSVWKSILYTSGRSLDYTVNHVEWWSGVVLDDFLKISFTLKYFVLEIWTWNNVQFYRRRNRYINFLNVVRYFIMCSTASIKMLIGECIAYTCAVAQWITLPPVYSLARVRIYLASEGTHDISASFARMFVFNSNILSTVPHVWRRSRELSSFEYWQRRPR